MEGWKQFCYDPVLQPKTVLSLPPSNSTNHFQWWSNGDFELCFQYLVFTTLSTAIFGLLSMFYTGLYSTKEKRRRPVILIVRMLVAVFVTLNSITEFSVAFWLAQRRPYAALLAECVMIVSWSAHTITLWVFSQSMVYKGRGPLALNGGWYLTLIASILHFRTVIRWTQHPTEYGYISSDVYFVLLFRVTVYIHMGLQILYGLSLLFGVKGSEKSPVESPYSRRQRKTRVVSIQNEEEEEKEVKESVREKQPLIQSRWRAHECSYGTIHMARRVKVSPDLSRLNASEDGANLFSLLWFWWVLPLLRKGAMGFLDKPADLPRMPKNLKTSTMREKFYKTLLRMQHTSGSASSNQNQPVSSVVQSEGRATISTSGNTTSASFTESEVMLKSFTRSTPVQWTTSKEHSATSARGMAPDTVQNREGDRPSHSATNSASASHSKEAPRTTSRFFLFWALNRAFGLHYYPLGLLKFTTDLLGFAGPLLLYQLVSFIENKKEPMYYGYLFALGLLSSTLFGAILTSHFNYQVYKVGLKVRAALITEVYRKSLSISLTTLSQYSTGQVVNFMSTDTDRIVNFCQSFHQFWSLPFQIGVSLFLLHQQVGLAFLAGVAFCILLVPINRWLAVKIGQLSTKMMAQKDQRVKVISEVLAGIRVIKFYVWEKHFSSKIFKIRQKELRSLMGRKYLDALCVYFWATTPVLISILTFTTYVALGHHLTAAKVFTSVALFNILISPLNAFPWVINGLMEAWVSAKRVQVFLQLEEIDWAQYYVGYNKAKGEGDNFSKSRERDSTAISMQGATFSWRLEHPIVDAQQDNHSDHSDGKGKDLNGTENWTVTEWKLCDVNLFIPAGRFVGVVGKVGTGKSSLLAAITAEMRRISGQIYVEHLDEGFGLVTQEAWIQQATVKDNILFGRDLEPSFYQQVVAACALEEDLRVLPAGDETEVGENGVTLSGGQKARLTLARAVYQDKGCYLLDDPLAAVDAHVATHLYNHCIMGLLKHKTRILCTHHHRFLRHVDWVVVMDGGRVDEEHSGPPEKVLPWLEENMAQVDKKAAGKGTEVDEKHQEHSNEDVASSLDTTLESLGTDSSAGPSREQALVQEEEKEVGVVAFSVYLAYWAAVGAILAPAVFLALFLMQASKNINDWWLAYWISHSNKHPGALLNTTASYSTTLMGSGYGDGNQTVLREASDNLAFFLGIYGGLAAANSIFTLFRAFLYAYGGVCAAKVLHKKLLRSILNAPTAFFDITPIGRIVNRFSSDIYAIDDSLPFIMNILLAQTYGLLGTIAVTSYGLPWFTVMLVPLGVLYYYIQRFYRRTSRELKRLSSVTLSPVYAHFSETLSGVWTIRALRASSRFMDDNERKLDINQRANFGSYAVAQWLGLYLQLLGVAMVAGVSFLAVLEHHFSTVDPGLVGLAISYALSVTNLLSGVVTSFTETEKQMVSVERAMQYIHGAPAERDTGREEPPAGWPCSGIVEFRSVSLSYRENHPPALDKVSFITQPGEKVGIVGRTGAGKSSLLQALFRMVEINGGSILIDDVDIATLPLEKLRSVMAVIPQDPFLFSGSVRENLDPCNKHDDQELWTVLERCHLKGAVTNLGGLYSEVEEKGRVFSVGQRQLVCLARALLTRAKVICIDEATANVDLETDAHIQSTIREEFTGSTVFTIAHRIKTVLHSDHILVMEQGQIRECGTPSELLQNHSSHFLALYREHNR